jgi:hypothetical protein
MSITEFLVITGLAGMPALLASILIGMHASMRDYAAKLLVEAAVVLAVGGCYLYERYREGSSGPDSVPAAQRVRVNPWVHLLRGVS